MNAALPAGPPMQSSIVPDEINAIGNIGNDFHKAGVLGKDVIHAIYQLTRHADITHTVETGCGKSTLLFSRISGKHLCFTLGGAEDGGDGSLDAVRQSPLLDAGTVEFVLGPTQKTIPHFQFRDKYQVIFIDGPHGFPFPNIEYYYLYPQLEEGGLLILDDIHIPTIGQLYEFVKEDDMFKHISNVGTTAFFRRTAAPLFDPLGDGWWLQKYNSRRFAGLSGRYASRSIKHSIYIWLARLFGIPAADRFKAGYVKLMRR
jgi:hypothetical protein